MIQSKILRLTPKELKEIITFLHVKYGISGRDIAPFVRLKKSRVYQIIKGK